MSSSPNERLEYVNPEYKLKSDELCQTASDVMDANSEYATSIKRYGSFVVNSMQLASEQSNIIVLERRLKLPVLEEPYWSDIQPRIQKFVPDVGRNEFKHDYQFRDGLVIDHVSYYNHATRTLNDDDAKEDELGIEDLVKLTNEIENAEPIRKFQIQRTKLYKVIDAILEHV